MGMKSISVFFLLALAVSGCGSGDGDSSPTSPSVNVPFSTTDLRVGTGAEATLGRTATVNYTGWLYSTTAADNKGTMFDSSLSPNRTPYVFTVGTGVIQGFSQGTIGMRVGGQRRVIIPPSMGYGSQGSGPIPPNATLVFELELLAVQ
jgi:FKBP-type peptidyl-prolyl cis-trans isomerase FkpA